MIIWVNDTFGLQNNIVAGGVCLLFVFAAVAVILKTYTNTMKYSPTQTKTTTLIPLPFMKKQDYVVGVSFVVILLILNFFGNQIGNVLCELSGLTNSGVAAIYFIFALAMVALLFRTYANPAK